MIQGLISAILLLFLSILLIIRSPFFRNSSISKAWILSAFALKILATVFLWWLYTFYYSERSTADIYKYFDDAEAFYQSTQNNTDLRLDLFNPFKERSEKMQTALQNTQHWDSQSTFLINDNRTISRIHFLLLFLSGGFFFFHQLFFSILSFFGIFALFRFFEKHSKQSKKVLFIATLLFPSTLLWTSGALKEAWLFFNLGLFLFHFEKFMQLKSFKSACLSLLFLILLLGVKIYVLVVLIPSLTIYVLIKETKLKPTLVVLLTTASIFLFTFLFMDSLFSQLHSKQAAFIELAKENQAGSFFEISKLNVPIDLVLNTPEAFYNTLIRPLFPPNLSVLSLMSTLEQVIILLFVVLAVFYPRKKSASAKILDHSFLPFIVLLALLIGYTIPVLGAIVRYRVAFMPFLLFTLLTFVDFKRVPILKRVL